MNKLPGSLRSDILKKLGMIMLFATVFLSACSGGGGGNDAASSSSTPTASSAASQTPSNSPESSMSAKPVTIDFWHAYGEGEEKVLKEEVIPAFNAKYPNITVNAIRMPTENLDQQVLTAAAGGAMPDLMRMDNTWISRFAKEGALQPVDGFPNFDTIQADSFKGPMDTNFYDGKYYGVPLDTNTKVAIYNKELLQKAGASAPPTTMDELVDLARKLKSQGKFYGITIGGVDTWNMPPFFWTLGGTYTDDKFTTASGYLNSPESVKALETIVAWHEEGLLAPPILGGAPGTWEGLRGDKGAPPTYMMINDGPWFYGILGDEVKDTMIPAKMPNGPDGQSHSVIGGQDMVIFKGAKHPEEAWVFTQFMLSEEMQVLMTVKTGSIPTNMNASKSEQLKSVYFLQPFLDEIITANARTPNPRWNEMSDVIQKAFESVLRKKSSPQEALDQAAKDVDAILSAK